MPDVFVDTSFLIAVNNPSDQNHQVAVAAYSRVRGETHHVTHEVLGEFLTYASRNEVSRRAAIRVLEEIEEDPWVVIHPQTEESFHSAVLLYRQRYDKGYSFCDCRSMILMRELEIQSVLTNDHHFAQEGFEKLF